jgi:hypothetical protein
MIPRVFQDAWSTLYARSVPVAMLGVPADRTLRDDLLPPTEQDLLTRALLRSGTPWSPQDAWRVLDWAYAVRLETVTLTLALSGRMALRVTADGDIRLVENRL